MPGLFDPFTVKNLTLKNRIVMAPMGTRLANSEGEVNDRHISHYTKRAAGNLGLIIVEVVFVTPGGKSDCHQLGISHDGHIPGMRRLASAIQEAGASPGIQLYHAGPRVEERELDPVSPSGVMMRREWDANLRGEPRDPRILTEEEIEEIVKDFADAAVRAVEAGFEVIEIHGAHGHLLSHFLSPLTNLRADKYGGDINGRVTFPCAVVRGVRKSIGGDFPLLYRHGTCDFTPGGLTEEEGQQAAKALIEAGVDVLDVSGGLCGSGRNRFTEQGFFVPLAEGVKRVTGAPVIGVGCIRDPEYADRVVREGRIDLVALGRGLLEEPLWGLRAAERLGVKVEAKDV